MELMMLLCKDPPQPSQITTTESTPGLIHNGKRITQKNGRRKLLKLLKVDTTWLPKEDTEFTLLKHLMFQITTIESMPGLMHNGRKIIQKNGRKKLKLKPMELMMLLLKPQPSQITTTESTPGLMHNGRKIIQKNGRQKLKLKHLELMMLLLKPQPSQITTIESMPGLIHNGRKTTQKNGKRKLLKLLKVDTMSLLKKDIEIISPKPQQSQITTTESMPGLILNGKRTTQKNGRRKPLKLLKVDTTWLPREVTEFQETILFHWKLQRPQIITTYKMPGLMIKQKTWMKKVIIRRQQNHLSINQEHETLI